MSADAAGGRAKNAGSNAGRWTVRRAVAAVAIVAVGCLGIGVGIGRWTAPDPDPPTWHDRLVAVRGDPELGHLREAALATLDTSEDPRDLAEATDMLGLTGRPGDEELLDSLVATHEDGLASSAIAALGRMGTDEAVALLVARADDPQVATNVVAWALGQTRNPRAVDPLLRLVHDPRAEASAMDGLAEVGGDRALGALWAAVDDGSSTAARVLASRAARDPLIAGRVAEIVAGPRGPVRDGVLEGLVESKDPIARDALLADLRSGNGPVASRAAAVLARLDDPSVVPALRVAAERGNRSLRYSAITALASQSNDVADAAVLALAEGPNGDVAMAAVRAMRDLAAPGTSERLIALANRSGAAMREVVWYRLFTWPWATVPDEVLAEAHRALAGSATADDAAIRLVLRSATPEDWAVLEAVPHRSRMSLVYALSGESRPEAVELLHALADDPDNSVRARALDQLLQRGEVALVEELALSRLGRTADYGETEGLLVEIGTPRTDAALMARVRSGTRIERMGAVQAIAGRGSHDQAAQLLAVVDGIEDDAERAQILGTLASSEVVGPRDLLARCDDDNEELAQIRVRVLERDGSPDASSRLLDLTGSDDVSVRGAALDALGRLGGADAEVALLDALHDPNLGWNAVNGLQRLGTPSAHEALRDAANGEGVPVEVQNRVISAIRWTDEPDGADLLVETLDHDDPTVRQSALQALGEIGTTDAAERLARFLSDHPDGDDGRIAANTLKMLGGKVAEAHDAEIRAVTGADDEPLE